MWRTTLLWVSTAPFEGPVVPPVYCISNGSSPLTLTFTGSAGYSCMRSVNRYTGTGDSGNLSGCASGRKSLKPVSAMAFSLTLSMTWLILPQKTSSASRILAPESLSWYSSSLGVSSGLTPERTQPALEMAGMTIK